MKKIEEKYYIAEQIDNKYYPVICDSNLYGDFYYDNISDAQYDKDYLKSDYENNLVIIKVTEEIMDKNYD